MLVPDVSLFVAKQGKYVDTLSSMSFRSPFTSGHWHTVTPSTAYDKM